MWIFHKLVGLYTDIAQGSCLNVDFVQGSCLNVDIIDVNCSNVHFTHVICFKPEDYTSDFHCSKKF